MLKKINIEEKLAKVKFDDKNSEEVLREVRQILETKSKHQTRIQNNIESSSNNPENHFDFDQLETAKIYHKSQIRQICIDYRLRFLSSKYFKGDFPQEVFQKISNLEKNHNLEIKGFKIVAPSKLFKLKDKDDPLLFAPIGNDYFYLIHKWGNDLHPLRKIFMWPFKNITNLLVLVFSLSYLATLMIPEGLFSKASTNAEFWIIFFFTFKSITAVVIFYGISLGKNFNTAIWNSKYLKA